jgi:hypothetical protein
VDWNHQLLALLVLIVLMTLFAVRMNVLFSFWYNGFYRAMQSLDAKAFWFMLLVFATLATVHVTRALLTFYLRQTLLIRWRVRLTNTLIERWLERQAYYRSQFVAGSAAVCWDFIRRRSNCWAKAIGNCTICRRRVARARGETCPNLPAHRDVKPFFYQRRKSCKFKSTPTTTSMATKHSRITSATSWPAHWLTFVAISPELRSIWATKSATGRMQATSAA